MVFFTSDLHFGHNNIISFSQRPYESVYEMNRSLIQNINAICSKRDTLVILGDVAYHQPVEETEEMLSSLSPKLVLIRGNHDKTYNEKLFIGIHDYYEIKLYHRLVVLSHYPILEWNGMQRESLHLHGHQHNFEIYNIENRNAHLLRYDVGVDANNYYPISIQQIFNFFHLSTDNYRNSMKNLSWN